MKRHFVLISLGIALVMLLCVNVSAADPIHSYMSFTYLSEYTLSSGFTLVIPEETEGIAEGDSGLATEQPEGGSATEQPEGSEDPSGTDVPSDAGDGLATDAPINAGGGSETDDSVVGESADGPVIIGDDYGTVPDSSHDGSSNADEGSSDNSESGSDSQSADSGISDSESGSSGEQSGE